VVGQDEAVQAVADAVLRARARIKDPNRPIGSFIFLGPTGVGKTELARALAETLFDDENNMIRIDMSEYMEKHAVARLIGAPPGYVGYDEGGQLTEAVRRKPFSVILFDEIEKAHHDAFNIFLQILEIQLSRLQQRLQERRMTLELTDSAKDYLVRTGFDPAFGARPLKRAIQREVETPLARRMVTGAIRDGMHVIVDAVGDGLVFKAEERLAAAA
jgi:ATP-dependent Clp protease ATP-binding subunit ClpA